MLLKGWLVSLAILGILIFVASWALKRELAQDFDSANPWHVAERDLYMKAKPATVLLFAIDLVTGLVILSL